MPGPYSGSVTLSRHKILNIAEDQRAAGSPIRSGVVSIQEPS
jgi:hypothetical protein